ncbi:MAG: serine hydrolase domain-containing protein [Thermodesulfobacteriota bacterium]
MKNIKEIENRCRRAIQEGIFPGVALGIAVGKRGGRKERILFQGTTRYEEGEPIDSSTLFDLASLTKPLATTLLILTLVEEKRIGVDDSLGRFFKEVPADKGGITLRNLLAHNSGLAAHQPYYQRLNDLPRAERKGELLRTILAETLRYRIGSTAVYSDLGFLLLGMVVEEVTGQGLDILFRERIANPLGIEESLFYNHTAAPRPGSYAATEFCPWRGRVLRGEVSDENCFALGGVAGHAGLFGTLGATLTLVTAIHDLWLGETSPLAIGPSALQEFLTRQPVPDSTWALGFDTPSAIGSTSGRFFSPTSVGHLGFTGTSFWIDPSQHVVVVLLSNRVHPSRENSGIKTFRPAIHDAVMEAMGLAA